MYGYYRIAAAVPRVSVADVDYNVERLIASYQQAVQHQCAAVVFPELCVTGYSCGDLFFHPLLLQKAAAGASQFVKETVGHKTIAIFGLPVRCGEALYNGAIVAQDGIMRAFVPKKLLPNTREFYERRQFQSGSILQESTVNIDGRPVAVASDTVFCAGDTPFTFGVELCEDLWGVIPPGSFLALGGARVLMNLSASTEGAGKSDYRRDLVRQQSGRCLAAYAFASAGVGESTTDVVFGGHALIAENGRLAAETTRFCRSDTIIYADVDLDRLGAARISESSFNACRDSLNVHLQQMCLDEVPESPDMAYAWNPAHPFIPPHDAAPARCHEIINIQTAGLAKRVEHTHASKLVVGISGGLDSTLALLVSVRCLQLLGRPVSDIIAVTMPGFGTTDRTYANAIAMCQLVGAELREIPIREACLQHFNDIGHDPKETTTTYENAQARERTQILMDIANKENGLVVGTGDLSEIALGWSTYNGDHMSMYAVNCSIPKTLIRLLIQTIAQEAGGELEAVLRDVNETPVSPELLPSDPQGHIAQKTETVLGSYELHDYFLYHFMKHAASPAKIYYMATQAFQGTYEPAYIGQCLKTFLRRFFTQQFKRNCCPDGPKVGSIALSPRGDWRMPSDATVTVWMQELDKVLTHEQSPS